MNKRSYIGFKTLIIKETFRILRIWIQSIFPSAITITLYFLIFGSLIGPRIGLMEGFKYPVYIAPGLIMMSIINNAYANVSGSFYIDKLQRSVEELLVSPVPNHLVLLGYMAGGIVRGVIIAIVVSIISLFFTKLHIHHFLIMMLVVVLSASMFSLAGFVNGIIANSFDDISIIPTFILTPLTYLGGVFYSVKILPPFWHSISLVNPILYMVSTFRYSMLGISDVNVFMAIAMIVFFNLLLFAISLVLMNKGVGIRT